jgi:hypothetical protein
LGWIPNNRAASTLYHNTLNQTKKQRVVTEIAGAVHRFRRNAFEAAFALRRKLVGKMHRKSGNVVAMIAQGQRHRATLRR